MADQNRDPQQTTSGGEQGQQGQQNVEDEPTQQIDISSQPSRESETDESSRMGASQRERSMAHDRGQRGRDDSDIESDLDRDVGVESDLDDIDEDEDTGSNR